MKCFACEEEFEEGRFCPRCGTALPTNDSSPIPADTLQQNSAVTYQHPYQQTYHQAAPAQNQRLRAKKLSGKDIAILIFCGIFMLFFTIMIFSENDGSVSTARSATIKSENIEYIEVTASKLISDYEDNKVAADQKYEGKWLKVTGTISSIDTDIGGDVYICLEDGSDAWSFTDVQCYFNDDSIDSVASLKNGNIVTVIGKCTGMSWNVGLSDCELN